MINVHVVHRNRHRPWDGADRGTPLACWIAYGLYKLRGTAKVIPEELLLCVEIVLALIGVTILLAAIPGPNVALIVENTIERGPRFSAMTVVGTTVGVALQLGVVVLGFTALLKVATSALVWIKWAGGAYLFYLGVVSWRRAMSDLKSQTPSFKPIGRMFLQGILLAAVNPKTLLFNAAFLTQFVMD